jgi:hypothetical protein
MMIHGRVRWHLTLTPVLLSAAAGVATAAGSGSVTIVKKWKEIPPQIYERFVRPPKQIREGCHPFYIRAGIMVSAEQAKWRRG